MPDPATFPIKLVNVGRGVEPGSVRVELEVCRAVAEWLGALGTALAPIVGTVERDRREEAARSANHARLEERFRRLDRAGRLGFHRIRKTQASAGLADLPPAERRRLVIEELAAEHGLGFEAVEAAVLRYKRVFLRKVRVRRKRRILELADRGRLAAMVQI